MALEVKLEIGAIIGPTRYAEKTVQTISIYFDSNWLGSISRWQYHSTKKRTTFLMETAQDTSKALVLKDLPDTASDPEYLAFCDRFFGFADEIPNENVLQGFLISKVVEL